MVEKNSCNGTQIGWIQKWVKRIYATVSIPQKEKKDICFED